MIGNTGRIVSIFIVAKFFGAKFAGGPYHEISGYVSFPIALAAMLALSRLLDMPIFEAVKAVKAANLEPPPGGDAGGAPGGGTPTYDY
jgi:hypothetical protein